MCETERFFFFRVKILATLTPRLFSWTRHSPAHPQDAHLRHAHPRRPVPALLRHGVGRARPRAHEERFRPRVRRAGAYAAEAMFGSSREPTGARSLEIRVHAGHCVQPRERHRQRLGTRSVDPEHVLLPAQEAVRDRAGVPRPDRAGREGKPRVLGGETLETIFRRGARRGRDALSPNRRRKNAHRPVPPSSSRRLPRPTARATGCTTTYSSRGTMKCASRTRTARSCRTSGTSRRDRRSGPRRGSKTNPEREGWKTSSSFDDVFVRGVADRASSRFRTINE